MIVIGMKRVLGVSFAVCFAVWTGSGLAACASSEKSGGSVAGSHDRGDYEKLVARQTRSVDKYSGLYQTFQASVTLLTTDVLTEQLQVRGEFLSWDATQTQKERDRAFQDAAAATRAFLRFYSPETDYNDLNKGTSIWKIYLEQGGKRYEGQVRKSPEKLVELQMLYPHLDRFSTPYEVTFKVPTSAIDGAPVKVVLTGSLGTGEFEFGPK
jgi:hypothetical protein